MPSSFPHPRPRTLAAAIAALATAAAVHAQTPPLPHYLYTDASALPGGDGSDWLHAFRDLQDALAAVPASAASGDRYEIHIAQGIYRPDRGTHDRNASFTVNSGVSLIGGFGGLLSPNPDQGDPSFVSVLSGDLNADDGPNFANTADNSLHVVRITGETPIPGYTPPIYFNQLSSFTIAGGNASGPAPNDSGGGVLAAGGVHVAIQGCTIRNNHAVNGPAADFSGAYGLQIGNSSITDNQSSGWVGGIAVGGTNNVIGSCTISRNRCTTGSGGLLGKDLFIDQCLIADNNGASGAGLSLSGSGSIQNSVIAGNIATSEGGGAAFTTQGNYSLVSSLIAHNTAPKGAGISTGQSSLNIANCTLVRNAAASFGGAVYTMPAAIGTLRIWNSILWSNAAPAGPTVYNLSGGASIDHSILQGGAPGVALGPEVIASDPMFVDPIGASSAPTSWADKNYRVSSHSPAIDSGAEPSTQLRNLYTDASAASGFVGGAWSPRLVNSTCAAYAKIDLGAYEFQGFACQPIIPITYVRAGAPVGGDGRSWATAFRDLQDALGEPGVTTIWIAQGIYTPDRGGFDPISRFRIEKPFVNLYGGFAGSETSLSQRNIAAHPTILSADLLANDSSSPASRLDNTSCILQVFLPYGFLSSTIYTVTLSGLTFSGAQVSDPDRADDAAVLLLGSTYMGNAFTLSDCSFLDNHNAIPQANTYAGAGGGALRAGGQSLTLERCTFTGNSSARLGGALYSGAAITATDCTFTANLAGTGGGAIAMDDYGAAAILRRCSFVGNAAVGRGVISGGAAYVSRTSTIDSCRFLGNIAFTYGPLSTNPAVGALGGALSIGGFDSALLTNSLFAGNRCAGPGAAGSAVRSSYSVQMINCTVANNAAAPTLGAIAAEAAVVTSDGEVSNCIFWNSAAFGAGTFSGVRTAWYNSPVVHNCLGQDDSSAPIDPLFTNPAGPDGIIGTSDDDYSLRSDSPAIDAADSSRLPAGTTLDLAGHPRFVDARNVPNTGAGTPNYLDIGALEFTDPHACTADFNNSGSVSTQDIFDYLSAWFAGDLRADINGNGLATSDILDFLTAWFTGC